MSIQAWGILVYVFGVTALGFYVLVDAILPPARR